MDPDPEPSPIPTTGKSRRLSLRLRVVLLTATINVLVFVAGGVWLGKGFGEIQGETSRRLFDQLMFSIAGNIEAGDDLDVKQILLDPQWKLVADAMIVSDNLEEVRGEVLTHGVAINPLGRAGRGGGGDQEILRAMLKATKTGKRVEAAGGLVVLIEDKRGTWGAFWYRLPEVLVDNSAIEMTLIGWLLVSTVLLTGGTFIALSSLVLGPVDRLAKAVRRIADGDLTSRVTQAGGSAELEDLSQGFNAMATEVEGFNARLADEVRVATSAARTAEQAAMTQRRLAAMGEFAAGIAHEINNPLGGLLNAVEVIGKPETPPEKQSRYVALLHGGLERIRDTVGQLLRFTPRETAAVQVDLAEVALDSIALVNHRAAGLGIEVVLLMEGKPVDPGQAEPALARVVVFGARNELGQAMINLLGNAIDALEEAQSRGARASKQDRIELRLSLSEGAAPSVVVSDNGPGVTREELERVADMFFTTKEVGRGTGLGLSIVHRIVDAHEGRVLIDSEPGMGFHVRLEFPSAAGHAASLLARDPGEQKAAAFRPSHGPKAAQDGPQDPDASS